MPYGKSSNLSYLNVTSPIFLLCCSVGASANTGVNAVKTSARELHREDVSRSRARGCARVDGSNKRTSGKSEAPLVLLLP